MSAAESVDTDISVERWGEQVGTYFLKMFRKGMVAWENLWTKMVSNSRFR